MSAARVQSLGTDARLDDMGEDERDDILEFLDRYEMPFRGRFKKIVNAGERLRYATAEPRTRPIPFFNFSGDCDYWNPQGPRGHLRQVPGRPLPHPRLRRRARAVPHLSDIAFRKDIGDAGDVPDAVSRGAHGDRDRRGAAAPTPLRLSMPVMWWRR